MLTMFIKAGFDLLTVFAVLLFQATVVCWPFLAIYGLVQLFN